MITPEKLIHIHYNKKNRRFFNLTYILIFCVLFILIITASIMCMEGIHFPENDKDKFDPSYNGWYIL